MTPWHQSSIEVREVPLGVEEYSSAGNRSSIPILFILSMCFSKESLSKSFSLVFRATRNKVRERENELILTENAFQISISIIPPATINAAAATHPPPASAATNHH